MSGSWHGVLAMALLVASLASLFRLRLPRSETYLGSVYDDLGHGAMNAVMASMFASASLMTWWGSGWPQACLALVLGLIAIAASVRWYRRRPHVSVLVGPWITLAQAGVMAYSMSRDSSMPSMPGMSMSSGIAMPWLAWLLIVLLAMDALATAVVRLPISVAYPHVVMDIALIAMLGLAL